jgi:transposase InsO family protein
MHYAQRKVYAERPLQKLSVDICTVNDKTLCSATMFLLVIDEYSRYKWCYLLQRKSQAAQCLITLIKQLNVRFKSQQYQVEVVHSDQGGEFENNELKAFYAAHGIEQITTNAYSPQENGIVERANGTVMRKVRAILQMTRLPDLLWVKLCYMWLQPKTRRHRRRSRI